MTEGILESVFGKKSEEPHILTIGWGDAEVKVPMRTNIGSKEQDNWRDVHGKEFVTKDEDGKAVTNVPLFVAQLLKDFSTNQDLRTADVKELSAEVEIEMTLSAQMVITDWWGDLCGLTMEKLTALANSEDFRQSR